MLIKNQKQLNTYIDKLKDEVEMMYHSVRDVEATDWLRFKIHQYVKGSWVKTRVLSQREQEVKKKGLTVYIEPTYENLWEPLPMTYADFMNWKIEKKKEPLKAKKKVALDVDGVLANFYKAVCTLMDKPYEKVDVWNLDWSSDSYGLWGNLDGFIEGFPVLNEPKRIKFDFDLYLTAIPEDRLHERTKWLNKNGFPDKPVVSCYRKTDYMIRNDIDTIIDDKPKTIKEARLLGKQAIQYIPPYFETTPLAGGQFFTKLEDIRI